MRSTVCLLLLFPATLLAQPAEAEKGPPPRIVQYWPRELVPALVQSLNDPDVDVQQYSRSTLLNIGPEAVPGLIQGLKSPEPQLRRLAASILGDMAGEESIPALIQAMQDKDPEVRRAAAYALNQIVIASRR